MQASQMKNQIFVCFSVVVILLFGVVILGESAQEGKPDVIRSGHFNVAGMRTLGKAQGWYSEATGTEVKWIWTKSGADTLTMLAAGELDIAGLGSAPTAVGVARGIDLKIIAISFDTSRAEALVAREGIYTIYDLIGKKIGVPFASTSHYELLKALEVYGIKPTELTILDMKPLEIAAAFRRGDIDGGWSWDPGYTKMLEADGHVVMTSEDLRFMGYPTWDDIIVRKEFADKYPGTLAKWLTALLRSIDYYYQHPEKAAEVVAAELGEPYEDIRDITSKYYYPTGEEQISNTWLGKPGELGLAADALLDQTTFLYEQGQINDLVKPETYDKVVDSSYLVRAMEAMRSE